VRAACASKTWKPEFSYCCLRHLRVDGVRLLDIFTPELCHIYPTTKDTHFKCLRELTNVPYDRMLFFDDCTWGDNFADVRRVSDGRVRCIRTPHGLQPHEWYDGLRLFALGRTTSHKRAAERSVPPADEAAARHDDHHPLLHHPSTRAAATSDDGSQLDTGTMSASSSEESLALDENSADA